MARRTTILLDEESDPVVDLAIVRTCLRELEHQVFPE
jgi:hypothetical protein